MPKFIEQARADIAKIVPHLRVAAEDAKRRAKADATIQFAIIAKNPNGSGAIGASFECDEFLTDLEAVFPPTEQDVLAARAACLLKGQ